MILLIIYTAIILLYAWISLEFFFDYNDKCTQLSGLAFIFAVINIIMAYTIPEHNFLCKESSVLLSMFGVAIYFGNETAWEYDSQRLCC